MTKRRRWLRLSGLLALGAAVAVAVIAAGVFPFRQIVAQEDAVDLAAQKLAALETENDRLEADIAALGTPAEVERLAREQFGLVRPGEVGYVVVVPPDTGVAETEPEATLDRPPSKPWWRGIWDFLTGGDQADG